MEKSFLPYNESLAMASFGFNENCLCYYGFAVDQVADDPILKPVDTDLVSFRSVLYPSIKAPLYHQAFEWFSNVHNLLCDIGSSINGYSIEIMEKNKNDGYLDMVYSSDNEAFDTRHKAELFAIKEMLAILEKIGPSIKVPLGLRRSALLDPMDHELSFIHDSIRNQDFDLGFKTGWVTKESKQNKS
jgi:hypothetical protein